MIFRNNIFPWVFELILHINNIEMHTILITKL